MLTADQAGSARVQLLSSGDVWDWLEFAAEPAVTAEFEAATNLFAGDTMWVAVGEVFGECGEECVLIGGNFISWTAEPAGALTFEVEEERLALFATDAAGTGAVTITGTEPGEGNVVLQHAFTLVPAAGAGDLEAEVLVMLPDETMLDPQPLPTEIPVGSLCQIRYHSAAGGTDVPLSRFAVETTVGGDAGVLSEYALGDHEAPDGPIFEVVGPGTASISATSALIGSGVAVDLVAVE